MKCVGVRRALTVLPDWPSRVLPGSRKMLCFQERPAHIFIGLESDSNNIFKPAGLSSPQASAGSALTRFSWFCYKFAPGGLNSLTLASFEHSTREPGTDSISVKEMHGTVT